LHLNLQNPVYRRITLSALEHATAVFYVTPNLKGYLGAYENKLVYLPNPVDVQAIARDPIAPARVAKVLIFTRLDPVTGVDQIFPAAQTLSRTIELTALSWGPLRTSYRQTYGRFVSFVRPLPRPAIGPFLQQFDLVIGQMQQGILSLMEIEAMAAGRPVITGINLDLYRDDPPPVLRASDPERIIAAVESLRSRPQELARLSRDGRDWVVRNHSHAHHLEVLEAAYFGKA
ncbi:MAG TPA: glycosyltransferase, partial [Vicinamibacterales bacterium]